MTKELLRTIYPRLCPGCREVLPPDMTVCQDCSQRFRRIEPPYCLKCGRHIKSDEELLCSECLKKDHHYDRGFATFEYDNFMRQSMSDFKFNGMKENYLFYIEETMAAYGEAIMEYAPKAIIPIPIHWTKRAYRGYNQTEVLVRELSERTGIPHVDDFLVRTRRTDASKKLNSRQRRVNLGGAFACNTSRYSPEIVNSRFNKILLVDDIYTTGSTMERCTLELKRAGVREVGILSISIGSVL